MEELKLNHTYLLQFRNGDSVSSVTILMVTDKAYHIRWNRGIESNDTWEQKKIINRYYNLLEDISDLITTQKIEEKLNDNSKVKFITCPICHGMGTVPDEKSSSGTITCPLCHGSKMIPETIEA